MRVHQITHPVVDTPTLGPRVYTRVAPMHTIQADCVQVGVVLHTSPRTRVAFTRQAAAADKRAHLC
jgi:hypothetical protein